MALPRSTRHRHIRHASSDPDGVPILEAKSISMHFGKVVALNDVSVKVHAGEVVCLIGDNGAGKSTLIKVLSGAYRPSLGKIWVKGKEVHWRSPGQAIRSGIATVYQDLAMFPHMSMTRNFFIGREPLTVGRGPFRRVDWKLAEQITREAMAKIGIDIRDPAQAVGTLSGGERQCLAIARAVHFGARVLILDEPTSALGVHQTAIVLRYIMRTRSRGLGVIFITHNAHHAYAVGDSFTVLNRGKGVGTFQRAQVSRGTVLGMMAGGHEMEVLSAELEELVRVHAASSGRVTARELAAEEALAIAVDEEAHKVLD